MLNTRTTLTWRKFTQTVLANEMAAVSVLVLGALMLILLSYTYRTLITDIRYDQASIYKRTNQAVLHQD